MLFGYPGCVELALWRRRQKTFKTKGTGGVSSSATSSKTVTDGFTMQAHCNRLRLMSWEFSQGAHSVCLIPPGTLQPWWWLSTLLWRIHGQSIFDRSGIELRRAARFRQEFRKQHRQSRQVSKIKQPGHTPNVTTSKRTRERQNCTACLTIKAHKIWFWNTFGGIKR